MCCVCRERAEEPLLLYWHWMLACETHSALAPRRSKEDSGRQEHKGDGRSRPNPGEWLWRRRRGEHVDSEARTTVADPLVRLHSGHRSRGTYPEIPEPRLLSIDRASVVPPVPREDRPDGWPRARARLDVAGLPLIRDRLVVPPPQIDRALTLSQSLLVDHGFCRAVVEPVGRDWNVPTGHKLFASWKFKPQVCTDGIRLVGAFGRSDLTRGCSHNG